METGKDGAGSMTTIDALRDLYRHYILTQAAVTREDNIRCLSALRAMAASAQIPFGEIEIGIVVAKIPITSSKENPVLKKEEIHA